MNSHFNSIDHELLVRFLSGDASEQEKTDVQQWIEADDQNQEYFDQLEILWNSSADARILSSIDLKKDWQKVQERISNTATQNQKGSFSLRITAYQLVRIAAVLVVAVGLYFTIPLLISQLIKPVTVAASNNPVLVTLPDGSEVYLNKNASLTYPEALDGKTRAVTLQGEAFFEITKDESRPFLIKSAQAVIEIVGTSFNVRNIDSTGVIVSVVTGTVLLYDEERETSKLTLKPGDQGSLDKTHGLLITSNMDVNFLSWKTGVLTFRNTGLKQVVSDLNRHYGNRFELASTALESCTLTSTFDHQAIGEVLEELRLVLPIQIQEKGNVIIISGEGCNPGQ